MIAISIAAIMLLERFTQRIDKLITTLKSSRNAPGQEILTHAGH